MNLNADIRKIERNYFPKDAEITNWPSLEKYFTELNQRPIKQLSDLEQWLHDLNELQAVISEDVCWRQIRMTCDTENQELEEAFNFFCMEIEPHIKPYMDALNKKLLASPFLKSLDQKKYQTYIRNIEKDIRLYRAENVQIIAELNVLAQQYGAITGKMTVQVQGREYTLQQAAKFLMQSDRAVRKEVYEAVNERRMQDKAPLNDLFDQLLQKRHQVALNAGFSNYRDYKFQELGRFDYTVEDCRNFHESIRTYIRPLAEELYQHKQTQLQLNELLPYDIEAEPEGQKPLEPFMNGDELLEKSIEVFHRLNPYFGDCLKKMKALGHFDLDSRKGKAPGGYNCPLSETGAPFIFMNAAGTADDVVTMMHEGGHALHSFLSHNLELSAFKEYPMEMAELASMSMELFSMDHWDVFYPDPNSLKRAKIEELERALSIFPWIASIDQFQHWLYTHPGHTVDERTAAWLEIHESFAPRNIQWGHYTHYREVLWQKQLHLFEVPFYYIEYGIAQLGALAMWRAYKENPTQTLHNYISALSKGGTQTLPDLYRTAGISFDFSAEHVASLCAFVQEELKQILQA
jgi:oligoendopeptidase F